MAPSRNYHLGLRVAVTMILIFFLTFPSSKSVGSSSYSENTLQQRKKVLGSRPPGCVNKCMNCRPCKAILVIPPHQRRPWGYRESSRGEDDGYYLLSWKCRCGNKLFHP